MNAIRYIIGFSDRFYTLWEASSRVIENGNSRYTYTEFRFVKNISFNLDKAKAAYPDAEVNLSIRGRRSFTYSDRVWVNVDRFQFGKYKGQLISECEDLNYVEWYCQQGIPEENKEACHELLKLNGYEIVDGFPISPANLERINKEIADVEEIELQLEQNGFAELTIVSNAFEDGNGYWLRTNVKNVRVLVEHAKALYYGGDWYYLPLINGKAKKLKNKSVIIYPEDIDVEVLWNGTRVLNIKANAVDIIKK